MIDFMMRRHGVPGACDVCQTRPATRRARFTAHFLQSDPTPLMTEEHIAKMQFEKLVCDDCAEQLQSMKNVTELTVEPV